MGVLAEIKDDALVVSQARLSSSKVSAIEGLAALRDISAKLDRHRLFLMIEAEKVESKEAVAEAAGMTTRQASAFVRRQLEIEDGG